MKKIHCMFRIFHKNSLEEKNESLYYLKNYEFLNFMLYSKRYINPFPIHYMQQTNLV